MDDIGILIDLSLQIPQPILIGGWATYALLDEGVTHDIDIIVEPWVRSLLRNIVDNYSENSHFGTVKGTGSVKGYPIDIYFLHESRLEGEISLDVTRLAEYVEGEWNGYLLLSKEAIIASKLPAAVGRSGTEKGRKDAHAILALIEAGGSPTKTRQIFEYAQTKPDASLWQVAEECLKANVETNGQRDIIHKFFHEAG